MAWLRDLEPDALALWAGREEFARAIRAAGFAGEIAGYYGAFEERYIGSDNPTIVEIATASPEFRQFVAERQVQVYARDMGWMTADIYLLIDGQVQAQISDRPGEFDRVMGVVTDLAVPMILTAGLSAAVAPVVAASGASGALATGLTRAGASTLFALATDRPVDIERIFTSALVAGGGEAALAWIDEAGVVNVDTSNWGTVDTTGTEWLTSDADTLTAGILDPWRTDELLTVTSAGIDFSDVAAVAAGGGVSLSDVVDVATVAEVIDRGLSAEVTEIFGADVLEVATVSDVIDAVQAAEGADVALVSNSIGDGFGGVIDFDPGLDVVDVVDVVDDVVDVVDVTSSPVVDPTEVDVFAPPPILEPTAPPAPIPTVTIAPPAPTSTAWTFEQVLKNATGAAMAAISVVRAWEARKLPVNPAARQTDARGNQQTVTRDGVIVTRGTDGRTTTTRPAVGEPRMTIDGTMIMNNGDGTFTRVSPDGRRETVPYPGAGGAGGAGGALGLPPELLYVAGGLVLLFALRR